eukprot:gnl/MRDRNA2_/MRDRNA2_158084_c0_seq1.p1 gnl/MRDRNA2_/MRDRNA2_158084_c0~~gnl/MRDRNA2_/MRDRNA2_158084_c0_seq1.p1  ORF type:complete len:176 (+),score=28.89 gnl/MRDRNA2_/MRDRNA2_158084_c0_seq1:1-528(+)
MDVADNIPYAKYYFSKPIAGYIKAGGAGIEGPPLFGFTKRRIKSGKMEDIKASSQKVFDYWYQNQPGVLAATFSVDEEDPNLVHDFRVFSNYDAYLAHSDKNDSELMALIGPFVESYDTSVPFTGVFFAGESQAQAIVDSHPTICAGILPFSYGDGILGPMPDMTKGDIRVFGLS